MKDFSMYQRSRLVFKVLLLLQMILMVIPYMNAVLMPYVRLFLVWGWGYILWDLLHGRKYWKNKGLLLLFGFCAAYGISILLNRDAGFSRNIKDLLYMLMVFVLFFGRDHSENAEQVRSERNFLSMELIVLTFLLSAICLTTFLLGIQYRYVIGEELCGIGMMGGRLWGLYNPNNAGGLEALSILLSLGFLSEKRTGAAAVFCRLNLVLQVLVLVLGHSRTSIYSLLAVLAVMLFVRLRRQARSLAISLLASVAFLGAGFLGDQVLFDGLMKMETALHPEVVVALADTQIKPEAAQQHVESALADTQIKPEAAQQYEAAAMSAGNVMNEQQFMTDRQFLEQQLMEDKASAEAKEPSETDSQPVDREALINEQFSYLEGREGGLLSGRPILWKAGLKTFAEHPLFGMTREGLYDAVSVHVEDEAWLPDLGGGGLHNIYLTILVSSGLAGALFYAVLLVVQGKKLLPLLLRSRGKMLPHFGADGWIVLLFVIVELAEARTMYQMRFFFVMFWMYFGYAVFEANQMIEEGENV